MIHIGLVNNMPGPALEATERQFRELLEAAAGGTSVRLSLFRLPEIPRQDPRYCSAAKLLDTRLDGVIVTGTEPVAPLRNEPYWDSLKTLVDWAEHNTCSSIWSCLAAHAAVLHLDGVERRQLTEKRFGIFEAARVEESPLTAGLPNRVKVPHSRWNDLPGDALASCGYRILSRSESAGIDTFVKQRKSLFLFFQGHPEYDSDTLLLEYRRDVRRFLRGERECYPNLPQGYMDESSASLLTALRERALADRREEWLAEFPLGRLAYQLRNTWRTAAVGLYHNWLRYLADQKSAQQRMSHAIPAPLLSPVEAGGAFADRRA